MWNFQQDKKRRIAAGEDVAQPFMTTGLFRYCRHPNYSLRNRHVVSVLPVRGRGVRRMGALDGPPGFIGLTLLFIPSLRMTESISVDKYPGYRDYQATTPALVPLPRTRRANTAG